MLYANQIRIRLKTPGPVTEPEKMDGDALVQLLV
jgi:hypothetical protein